MIFITIEVKAISLSNKNGSLFRNLCSNDGKIYEIKGDIFLDKDNHLINFYDRKLDYIQEAKEICMNKNKVIIIKTSELCNMIKHNTLLNFLEI